MRGSKAKKLRRLAAEQTRAWVAEHARLRPRWWMRIYLAALPVLRALGVRISESTARAIARRGIVAEIAE